MPEKILNPQEECLRALRELTQLGNEIYFAPNSVGYKVHENGLSLPIPVVKANLEYFVSTGEAKRVIVVRGWRALGADLRKNAQYTYRAVFQENPPNSP
jgi:hypothetical protein